VRAIRFSIGCAGAGLALLGVLADRLAGGSPGLGPSQLGLVGLGLLLGIAAFLPRRGILNLGLAAGAAVFSLALGEGALRLAYAKDFVSPYRLHPRYLHVLRPGVTRRFHHLPVNGGGVVTFHVNQDGFRGAPLRRRERQRRIVVYGDSFIEGEYAELADTFPAQLERRLAPHLAEGVEVINAGVTAYGPDQACLRIEDEVAALDPDLVILAVFADNDLGDLVRDKIFRLDGAGHLRENHPSLSTKLQRTWRQAETEPYLFKLLEKARQAWEDPEGAMRGTARGRIATWLYDSRMEFAQFSSGDDEVRRLLEDFYDADVSVAPSSRSARQKRALLEAVLARIRARLAGKGTPFFLLVIPSPIDVVDGYDYGQVDPGTYPEYRRTALSSAVADMAARQGIPCVNLFAPFRAARPESLYLRGGDNHWTPAGQALAARLMADFILERRPWDAAGAAPPAPPPPTAPAEEGARPARSGRRASRGSRPGAPSPAGSRRTRRDSRPGAPPRAAARPPRSTGARSPWRPPAARRCRRA
jgi:lysophospholipase L1-like esterase